MSVGGLSRDRLARLRGVMRDRVERGDAPGMVTAICRRGELFVDAIGVKALGTNDAMRRDTIFRIASVTKPIVAVAALSLLEETRFRLDDPVEALAGRHRVSAQEHAALGKHELDLAHPNGARRAAFVATRSRAPLRTAPS